MLNRDFNDVTKRLHVFVLSHDVNNVGYITIVNHLITSLAVDCAAAAVGIFVADWRSLEAGKVFLSLVI